MSRKLVRLGGPREGSNVLPGQRPEVRRGPQSHKLLESVFLVSKLIKQGMRHVEHTSSGRKQSAILKDTGSTVDEALNVPL